MHSREKIYVDGKALNLKIKIPTGSSKVVVACHGYRSNSNNEKIIELEKSLFADGIGMLKATFPSDLYSGSIAEFWVDALNAELRFLTGMYGVDAIGLFGISRGGSTVLRVASTNTSSNIKAVVSVSSPYENVLANYSNRNRISNLLVIHGLKDEAVNYENANQIYRLAKEPKKLILIDGADHRFSNPKQRSMVVDKAAEWFNRYL